MTDPVNTATNNAMAATVYPYERKIAAQKDWGATLSQPERTQIHKSAKSFEAMYMSEMMNHMFAGTDMSESGFGGGTGEEIFKSLLVNEYASKFSSSGQAMIAPHLEREMLRVQALQNDPHLDDLPQNPVNEVTP